jgi:ribonuclease P protein component
LVHQLQNSGPAQLGITVTRKVGSAVVRNRIKRSVRELFRRRRKLLADGLRVVVIARQGAGDLEGRAAAAELLPAFAKLEGDGLGEGAGA